MHRRARWSNFADRRDGMNRRMHGRVRRSNLTDRRHRIDRWIRDFAYRRSGSIWTGRRSRHGNRRAWDYSDRGHRMCGWVRNLPYGRSGSVWAGGGRRGWVDRICRARADDEGVADLQVVWVFVRI